VSSEGPYQIPGAVNIPGLGQVLIPEADAEEVLPGLVEALLRMTRQADFELDRAQLANGVLAALYGWDGKTAEGTMTVLWAHVAHEVAKMGISLQGLRIEVTEPPGPAIEDWLQGLDSNWIEQLFLSSGDYATPKGMQVKQALINRAQNTPKLWEEGEQSCV
jgi:hypothetical protein